MAIPRTGAQRKPPNVWARRTAGTSRFMARVVLVASSELDRNLLADVISPDDELHVVVPAVEQSRLQWLANDEDEARSEARRVGNAVASSASPDTSSVDVKPDAPLQVVRDAIAEHHPDRVVLALRETDAATWLEQGGLDEIPREIDGVPVIHVAV